MLAVISICLGACVGALSRWQLSLWLNHGHAVLPWGTLVANWAGAYLVGVAVVFFQSQTQLDPAWRLAIVTGFLGALKLEGPRFQYPLSVSHARRYYATRLALVGDAAHGIHPLAGQGINLGLRDVAALAHLVEDQARLGLDIGSTSLLEHYQRWRYFDGVVLCGVTDGLNRLFSNDFFPLPPRHGAAITEATARASQV